jgi:hypothetical protein
MVKYLSLIMSTYCFCFLTQPLFYKKSSMSKIILPFVGSNHSMYISTRTTMRYQMLLCIKKRPHSSQSLPQNASTTHILSASSTARLRTSKTHTSAITSFYCLTAASAAANPTVLKLPPRFSPPAVFFLASAPLPSLSAPGGLLHRRNTALRSRGAPSRTTVDTGTKGRSCALAARMP